MSQSAQQSEQQNSQPSLCVAGCGFFSNIGTNGMCSKCHRDTQKAEQESAKAQQNLAQAAQLVRNASAQNSPAPSSSSPAAAAAAAAPQPVVQHEQQSTAAVQEAAQPTTSASAPHVPSPAVAAAEASSSSPAQEASSATPPSKPPSTTRCLVCSKKVGLTGFNCKCNPDAVFCSTHRLAEAHDCTFDYKNAQRALLAERNPVCMGSKLQEKL